MNWLGELDTDVTTGARDISERGAAGPPDYENDNRDSAQENVIQWVREYTSNLSPLDSLRVERWPEREPELVLNMRATTDRVNAIAPRLIVRDAARAVQWYKKAFGA